MGKLFHVGIPQLGSDLPAVRRESSFEAMIPRGPRMVNGQAVTFDVRPFAGSDAETKLDVDVAVVIHDFRDHGTAKAMREASRRGILPGAKLYLDIRAETEEALAHRMAQLNASLAHAPRDLSLLMRRAFVAARLAEVRVAVKAGQTPGQAVVDRPEIPRTEVPRWVPFLALAMSAVALIRALGN